LISSTRKVSKCVVKNQLRPGLFYSNIEDVVPFNGDVVLFIPRLVHTLKLVRLAVLMSINDVPIGDVIVVIGYSQVTLSMEFSRKYISYLSQFKN